MQEPWKTDKWFSSPWSYLPEVRQKQAFGSNLKIHDVTLRDGEQQTAVVFRREEKVAIAKKLDSLGIHRIEAGMPAVSPQDKAAISDIAALGLKAEIFGFARCIPAEIEVIKACGCSGVVIEIPASDHMIKYGYGWPIERAMKASIETTLAAKAAGLYTVFFTIDATRTELNRFLDIVEQVATEGHMDALTIADTMGVCTPDAVSHVVKKVIDRLKKPVEIHCHQDFGLGVANTVAALAAGASVAQTTITGLGERAGNVPMEDVVMSLLCLHGVNLGIKTENFVEVSRLRHGARQGHAAAESADRRRQAVRDRVGDHRRLVPPGAQGSSAGVHPVRARARGSEAGVDRARQEQRAAVDGRVVREARHQGHRRRAHGDAAAGEGEVVREERSADGRRVQGDRRSRDAEDDCLNVTPNDFARPTPNTQT